MLARKIRLIVHAHRWSHDVTYRHYLRSPELIRTEDGSIERNSRRSTMVYEESFCDSSIDLPFYIVPCSPELLRDPYLRVGNVRRHHNRSTENWWQRQCNGQIMLSSPLQRIDQSFELKGRIVKRNLVPEISLVCDAKLIIPFVGWRIWFSERIERAD